VTDVLVTGRDPRIEDWLTERGVTWEFVEALAVADIDEWHSLTNQARLEALDAETVDRYAEDMKRGHVFPAILVRRRGSLLANLGGNHRVAGARKAKRKTLAAYVVECDDRTSRILALEDNRFHGLAPAEEERLLQAVQLVESGDADPFEAAAIVGVSGSKLARELVVVKGDRKAKQLGVTGWESLGKLARHRISQLDDDTLFEETARLAALSNMGSKDATEIVSRVNAAKTVTEALKILGTEREFREAILATKERPHRGRKNQRIRMLDAIADITALAPAMVVDECQSDDHREYLRLRCLAGAQILRRTLAALSRGAP
jgi:hypothetical protein